MMRLTRVTVVLFLLLGCLVPVSAVVADGFKFEIFQDAGKSYRWRLKNDEGRVVATPGQGYSSKKYCEESVEKFKSNLDSDKVKIEYYKDKGKRPQTRWRMIASNGQTVASSMFGYPTEEECKKAFELIKKEAMKAKVETIENPK